MATVLYNLRERFLERLAQALFRKRGEGFVLKGGGAMRARFGNERLTKDLDLDFTNPRRSADSLHNMIRQAIEQARRGLPVSDLQVSEPGKFETSPRWKVNFRDDQGLPVHVEIEVSRDPDRVAPGRVVQQRFQPLAARGAARFWVDIYDDATLVATKIAALLGRGAPRDVYDLDLLKEVADRPSPGLVAWAVRRAGIEDRRPTAVSWAQLDGLDWARYLAELRDSLPPDIAARIDEDEWTAMKLRVGEYVESLLDTAGAGS